jgi:hypothetical protein
MRLRKDWSAEAVRRNDQRVPRVHAAKSVTIKNADGFGQQ